MQAFLYNVSGIFFITYVCQRTFLGSIVQLLRLGERLFYQPWVLSRAVTAKEIEEAKKPWPYYYGHYYAIALSVFMIILVGSVITPVMAPFGLLYFGIYFITNKYLFLYVMEYTPGRGSVAKSAYHILYVCLVSTRSRVCVDSPRISNERTNVAAV